MKLFNTSESWGWLARLFHAVMAILILYMLGLGIYMVDFTNDVYEKLSYVELHKSWGFVAFFLAVLRIVWRWINPATPALPKETKRWERIAAHVTHYGLYVCMLSLPLSGWLMSSASPLQVDYGISNMVFGLFEMPDPFSSGSKVLSEQFKLIHEVSGNVLIALLILHAAAAGKHLFILKDNIVQRMTWGK